MVPALLFPGLAAAALQQLAVSTPLPVLDSDRPSLHEFDFFFLFDGGVTPALNLKCHLEIMPWENDTY